MVQHRVLFAWEWGTGLGHLRRFAPLADRLRQDGHQLVVAACDLSNVTQYFDPLVDAVVQALVAGRRPQPPPISAPVSIYGLAWNLGYDRPERVLAYIAAWQNIVTTYSIDFIVSDYGLAAGTVAEAVGIPWVRIGTGFGCPPHGDGCVSLRYLPGPAKAEKSVVEQLPQIIESSLRHLDQSEVAAYRRLSRLMI